MKKAQKAYTKLYYEQNKFSLIKENNEGFAKLSLLLLTVNKGCTVEEVWEKMLSLIGNFDLDPDRVLDLVIESFCSGKFKDLYF